VEAWQTSGGLSRSSQARPYRFYLLRTTEAYNENVFHKSEEETIRRAEYGLRGQAAQHGFQVIPTKKIVDVPCQSAWRQKSSLRVSRDLSHLGGRQECSSQACAHHLLTVREHSESWPNWT
jgi:hypothetical protein